MYLFKTETNTSKHIRIRKHNRFWDAFNLGPVRSANRMKYVSWYIGINRMVT